MNILLVNDDGYTSKGINLLKEVLLKYGDVYMVAPYEYMSGKSISLTIFEPLKIHKINDRSYAVEGTPADCVSFALTSLDIKFDLVISGINEGMNVTYDTLHSGTIGACIEALIYKTPAIAFSCHYNMEFVIDYVDMVMEYIFKHNLLSLDYLINVNFPYGNKIKGIIFSKLGYRNDKRGFRYDKENDLYVPIRTLIENDIDNLKLDIDVIRNGYISITPLSASLFNEDLYLKLKKDKNL